jgi:ATP-dependent DNA ligase
MAKAAPTGAAWVHEIKHDGYRLMVWRNGERVRLFTRRGYDWTHRYPRIVHSARKLRATRFLVDGEAVICGADGVSDFEKLHSGAYDASVILFAFDSLAVDGTDMRPERLDDRRARLCQLLVHPDGIRFSDHHAGDGERMFAHACKLSRASCRSGGMLPTDPAGVRHGSRSRTRTVPPHAGWST